VFGDKCGWNDEQSSGSRNRRLEEPSVIAPYYSSAEIDRNRPDMQVHGIRESACKAIPDGQNVWQIRQLGGGGTINLGGYLNVFTYFVDLPYAHVRICFHFRIQCPESKPTQCLLLECKDSFVAQCSAVQCNALLDEGISWCQWLSKRDL
jgi:hypothetical protein